MAESKYQLYVPQNEYGIVVNSNGYYMTEWDIICNRIWENRP